MPLSVPAMTRQIDRFSDIAASYDAVYCDLWGCLHDGVRAFPAAVAALRAFRGTGGRVVLLTNSPRTTRGLLGQLEALQVPRDCWDCIASSGDATRAALMTGTAGERVWHLGPDWDAGFFDDLPDSIRRVPLAEAQAILCTGLLEDRPHPDDHRSELTVARGLGLPLLCANPDLIVDRGSERIYCAGAVAALYTEMGGESRYFGKPHPPIYDLARRLLDEVAPGIEAQRILAIGDGIGTDIAGALGEDIDSLFVTGGLAAAETGTGADTGPDPAQLNAYLHAHGTSPTFAIGRLR